MAIRSGDPVDRPKPPPRTMRPGSGHLLFGVVALTFGLVVTRLSEQIVAYGAMGVGALEIVRGLVHLRRGS